ncbi:MAG: 6-phosphogluconolactonase [Acidocella sp. 20-63-7]|nr:MAG: 6-phosphogluconolactonase [Acidocella sp. 20-63-7]HQT45900.1 6-phosphogluconolactonase [Acidocella sp.]
MIREFPTAEELAGALAREVAAALAARLTRGGAAALAVSGGSTPLRFFRALAAQVLDWDKVTVTLVDDRWVGEDSPRSNAALVRAHLLQGRAAAARFVPLMNDAPTPEAGRAATEAALRKLPPLAAVVLGMGADGHTASFFPGGDRLAQALAPAQGEWVETMRAPGALEPRITLTLPPLLAAGFVALHIEGAAKRAVLEEALRPGPMVDLPVRAVLARAPQPVVFWSP